MKGFNPELIPDRYRGLEGLILWTKESLQADDIDTANWMLNDLYERYEHNIEQKFWVAWLYGQTYHGPGAWVLWNRFPDQDLVHPVTLREWWVDNKTKVPYQTDKNKQKAGLPDFYENYHSWLNGQLQMDVIKPDFDYMWDALPKAIGLGDFSRWYYLQTLSETIFDNQFDATSFRFNEVSPKNSYKTGALIAAGEYNWMGKRLDKFMNDWLEDAMTDVAKAAGVTRFQLETTLCSYKKLARAHDSRYIGYYLDRQASDIKACAGYTGVDWRPWWEAREERNISSEQEQLTLF